MKKKAIIRLVLLSMVALGTSAIFHSCFKDIPDKYILYSNNFDDSSSDRLKFYNQAGRIDSPMILAFNGSLVLGRFNNNLVSFKIDSVPEHNAVHIQFDLYIHDRWEGNHLDPITQIPDVWQLKLDQVPQMIRTFSNTSFSQSFPNDYNPIVTPNPPHSDAWALLPGVCALSNRQDGTSLYKIDFITAHTANSVALDMNDALQPFNEPCNKSWSIDNLVITVVKYK